MTGLGQSGIKERVWLLKDNNPDFTTYYTCDLEWVYVHPLTLSFLIYAKRIHLSLNVCNGTVLNKEKYVNYLAQ